MMFAYFGLSLFYLLAVTIIGLLILHTYRQVRFSLHLLFSLVYLITFFLGYPLSLTLSLGFDVALQQPKFLFLALFSALFGYLIYFAIYHWLGNTLSETTHTYSEFQQFAKFEAQLTACLLGLVALGTVGYFLYLNGLLLFKLERYNQIFAADSVSGVALKRFFYFFIPALLIYYFLNESKKRWWLFLLFGVSFGALTYFAVGGTRANIALAFALFFFIGIYQGYLSIWWLAIAGSVAIVAMFFLALARYGLNVNGTEAFYTFLYLTRDTFSPWENFTLLLANDLEFQGLMPIVRDFYVFIPKSLWAGRPDQILNTANYFTWEILGNYSGLAISPTLLGSFYIMGGFPLIALGMAFIGIMLNAFDRCLNTGRTHHKASSDAILKAYCFANLFNLIVLVREGADAFFSRWLFFSSIFVACWLVAKLISYVIEKMRWYKKVEIND